MTYRQDVKKPRLDVTERRIMTATKKHQKPCSGCGEPIRKGEEFVSVPRGTTPTTWHARCYSSEVTTSQADPERLAEARAKMEARQRELDERRQRNTSERMTA